MMHVIREGCKTLIEEGAWGVQKSLLVPAIVNYAQSVVAFGYRKVISIPFPPLPSFAEKAGPYLEQVRPYLEQCGSHIDKLAPFLKKSKPELIYGYIAISYAVNSLFRSHGQITNSFVQLFGCALYTWSQDHSHNYKLVQVTSSFTVFLVASVMLMTLNSLSNLKKRSSRPDETGKGGEGTGKHRTHGKTQPIGNGRNITFESTPKSESEDEQEEVEEQTISSSEQSEDKTPSNSKEEISSDSN